jgi:hypothetical protein
VSTVGYSYLPTLLILGNTLRNNNNNNNNNNRHHPHHYHHHHHHQTVAVVVNVIWFIFKLLERLTWYSGLFYFPWIFDRNLTFWHPKFLIFLAHPVGKM